MDLIELEVTEKYLLQMRQERYAKKNFIRRVKRLERNQRFYPDLSLSIRRKQHLYTSIPINNTEEYNINVFSDHCQCEELDLCSLDQYEFNENQKDDDQISNLSYQIHDYLEDEIQELSCINDSSDALMIPLHYYTTNLTLDYCEKFTVLARQSNLSKLHTNSFLSFIKSGLPVPNNMPSTEKEIRHVLGVQELFTKQSICLLCSSYFDYEQKKLFTL